MNNGRWIVIFLTVIGIALAGLLIATIIALSLIPIYTQNQSLGKSANPRTVYTLNNVTYSLNTGTNRKLRTIRSTISSLALTSDTITSIQNELNKNFGKIDAGVIISSAKLATSVNLLILELKVYFLKPCIDCEPNQKKLIQRALLIGHDITVNTQYYVDCSLSPRSLNSVVMTLQTDTNNTFQISRPIRTSLESIAQQMDPCQLPNITSTTVKVTTATSTIASTTETSTKIASMTGTGTITAATMGTGATVVSTTEAATTTVAITGTGTTRAATTGNNTIASKT